MTHDPYLRPANIDVTNTYRIDRLAFGYTSLPYEAIYVTCRTTRDYGQGHEEAVGAINKNLYVDDYLNSPENTEQAIKNKRMASKGDLRKL